MTTTQTTTHFFSLPLWRRRAAPVSSTASARHSLVESNADENGIIISGPTGPSLMLEKALPPIPMDVASSAGPLAATPETEEDATLSRDSTGVFPHSQSTSSAVSSPRSRLRKPSRPVTSPSASQTLAQASLGLGLPHVLPRAATSSSSEVNSVAFVSAGSDIPRSDLRRAKSYRGLNSMSSADDVSDDGHRRTRGVSLGPYNTPSPGTGTEGKGKGKAAGDESSSSTSRPLSRKSSFFSRKRNDSDKRTAPLPVSTSNSSGNLKPSISPLHPVSPLRVDMSNEPWYPESSTYDDRSTLRPPGLVRRHSERSGHLPSPPASPPYVTVETPALPTAHFAPDQRGSSKSQSLRRPRTADSASRSRSRSLFLDSTFAYASTLSPPPIPSMPSIPVEKDASSGHVAMSPPSSRPLPRTKTGGNPPLLHRLSMNFFSSSPKHNSINASGFFGDSISSSPTSSPIASPRVSLAKTPAEVPKPRMEEESPEVYLERLTEAVSKAEVATVLASSADSFHTRALRAYIARFDFTSDPLDVALRKLLMDVGLPKETQQIDRVIEAFATRYKECNPNLFTSDDHPYILAFSLIMLHTDAFNKSNKRKMTKPDYVKNTRLPGVPSEVLDCFYDNIVFVPFIFIEDPLDINGQRGLLTEGGPSRVNAVGGVASSPATGSTTNLLGRGSKIDPYYLITRNLLDSLRVDVESFVPLENPYSYEGTLGPWNEEELRHAFAKAGVIEINTFDNRRMSQQPYFALSVNGLSSPMMSSIGALPEPVVREMMTIKVTKVGLLNRKDDTVEGGKKALSRKWREWSVVLTGSQLLLFRDPSWANSLMEQVRSSDGHVLFPPDAVLRPDELISVKDSVAVFDRSYTKHEHTLRFVMPDGRQTLLQAPNDHELNEWISRINYASAFKTAGVRMRSMGMTGKEVELTGVAAAASHLKDIQHLASPSLRTRTWSDLSSDQSSHAIPVPNVLADVRPLGSRRNTVHVRTSGSFEDTAGVPETESSRQFQATFEEIKADLAAGRLTLSDDSSTTNGRPRAGSSASSLRSPMSDETDGSGFLSRTEVIRSKVRDLDSRISAAQTQLDADMRFVRNIAILTPFQRSTRDRLQTAVQNVSRRITQVRLEMAKLLCHREVLSNDLIAEERDWYRNKKVALRAAKEMLENTVDSGVPRMTLSRHSDHAPTDPQPVPRQQPSGSQRPESSIRESFYSALDFGVDSSSYSASVEEPNGHSSFPHTSQLVDSPFGTPFSYAGAASSVGSISVHDHDTAVETHGVGNAIRSVEFNRAEGVGGGQTHERFYTAPEVPEEAEDWNKTRAAKRVSLVKLPSDLRISMLFGKTRPLQADNPSSIPETSVPSSPTRSRSNTFDRTGLAYAMFDI